MPIDSLSGARPSAVRERVQQHYDTYPFPGRLNAYGPWTDLAPKLLAFLDLPPDAARGARVLDAGCGTGEFARSFARLGAEVTGLDLSEGALAAARSLDAEVGCRVDYRQADLLALPPLGLHDLVLSLGVLHHTADPALGFRNVVERVRPGGHIAFGLYSSVSRAHILLLRRVLRLVSRGDQERAIDIAQRWLRPALPLFVGKEHAGERARIADLLANPHERPVSLHTALGWCRDAGLDVVACSPSSSIEDYGALARLARKGNSWLAHFLIQARWILWNADYYVIGARRPER